MAIADYKTRFETLQTRERALLLAVILVLVYALWSLLLGGSQTQAQKRLKLQLDTANTTLEQQQQQLTILQAQVNADPDRALRQQLAAMNADIAKVETQLQQAAIGLVPAAALPKILEEVIVQSEGVRLVRIETLPIEELKIQPVDREKNSPVPEQPAGVFRHAVKLELNAGYFALQRYLAALQALDWRFYWDSLHYEVQRYPAGRAELIVYTLSSERGAIGE